MKPKKVIWILVLIVVAGAAIYGYKEYTRTNKKLTNVKPDFVVSSDSLIKEFEIADSASYKKYDNKVVEVTGTIKDFNAENFIILLGDSSKLSVVKCELDTSFRKKSPNPVVGSTVVIKGHFVGFQKDELMGLGTDVNLNRCVFELKINE